MNHKLSEKWIKASIIGTIWAASEIVLGSFLHNLKVPFSGNILTSIGVIILISISYVWAEKGLFWRAGLICAVMKTISPSAVIFGPMIAIFSEALLLELFVRLMGNTIPGFLIGAMMAMSWNLFQKIANYIIFYGSNIIEVYTNLLKMAQKQLNIQSDIVWLPIIILLIVYALFGLLAGVTGIVVGKKILKQTPSNTSAVARDQKLKAITFSESKFNYSVSWLFIDVSLIICGLFLLSKTSWMIWGSAIAAIVILWAFRYKGAFRQLKKPKFWIFFVFITLLTAFVFTSIQEGENLIAQGLLTGIQMNFRAVVLILGFSVLGTELFNPKIRNFFLKTSFKNLPLALELSFESLPLFIAMVPDFKTLIRNPVRIFCQVISQATNRLSEINEKTSFRQVIFIITGSVGEGKTAYTRNLIDIFKLNKISTGGILAERVMSGSYTTGYNLVDIETKKTEVFLTNDAGKESEKIGRFTICPEGFNMGQSILNPVSLIDKKIVIIDEIGPLELSDKGWSDSLKNLIIASRNHILITIRTTLVNDVIKKWDISDAVVFNISKTDYTTAGKSIMEQIKS